MISNTILRALQWLLCVVGLVDIEDPLGGSDAFRHVIGQAFGLYLS